MNDFIQTQLCILILLLLIEDSLGLRHGPTRTRTLVHRQFSNLFTLLTIIGYAFTHKYSFRFFQSEKGGFDCEVIFTNQSEEISVFIPAPLFRSLLGTVLIIVFLIGVSGLFLAVYILLYIARRFPPRPMV